MKKSQLKAMSSMNYLFLREVFKSDIKGRGNDGNNNECLIEELSLFLKEIAEETWNLEFIEIVRSELSEGSYLENKSISQIEDLLSSKIEYICSYKDSVLVEKYIKIIREILSE